MDATKIYVAYMIYLSTPFLGIDLNTDFCSTAATDGLFVLPKAHLLFAGSDTFPTMPSVGVSLYKCPAGVL